MIARWTRFAGVGMLGFVVQLAILWMLTTKLEMQYVAAVLLSVEGAILHNFVWHECWTWRDRVTETRKHGKHGGSAVFIRLLSFNATTGVISLAGNSVLTALCVSVLGLPVLSANVIAIASLTVLNFMAADRLTFIARAPRLVRTGRSLPGSSLVFPHKRSRSSFTTVRSQRSLRSAT